MTNTNTLKVQTDVGGVEVPLDEHWEEYTKSQRQRVKDAIKNVVKFMGMENFNSDANLHDTTADFCVPMTYQEAKDATNGAVIMEGDWGGQIYLSCPMKYVKCDKKTIIKLLIELDKLAWPCNEDDGTGLKFCRANPGTGIIGGMGGGVVLDELWINDEFEKIKPEIQRVLNGEFPSIKHQVVKIETKVGTVEVPLDKYWEEYTEGQRQSVEDLVRRIAESLKTKNIFTDGHKNDTTADFCVAMTYQEAKEATNGVVVLTTLDDMRYLTCPMKYVKCDEAALWQLLKDLDKLNDFPEEDEDDEDDEDDIYRLLEIQFRRANLGTYIHSDVQAQEELWISETYRHLEPQIQMVLDGEISRLPETKSA